MTKKKKKKKHMKKCTPSLATLIFHLTPVRIATIKNTNNKCWQGCGGKGTSYTSEANTTTVENNMEAS
jgi:hypothetical protein